MPNVPTLSSTPTSSTALPGWASVAASGSQVWNGQSGALTANAKKKPRNSIRCVPGSMFSWVRASNENVPAPNSRWLTTYSPIRLASMNRPPNRLTIRNLTAA